MQFGRVHLLFLSSSSQIHPLRIDCFLLFIKIIYLVQLLLTIYSQEQGHPLECHWLTRGNALKENWLSFPHKHQLSITPPLGMEAQFYLCKNVDQLSNHSIMLKRFNFNTLFCTILRLRITLNFIFNKFIIQGHSLKWVPETLFLSLFFFKVTYLISVISVERMPRLCFVS